MKLGRYDKCVEDCTIVIDMLKFIDLREQKSDIIFKAYVPSIHKWNSEKPCLLFTKL